MLSWHTYTQSLYDNLEGRLGRGRPLNALLAPHHVSLETFRYISTLVSALTALQV